MNNINFNNLEKLINFQKNLYDKYDFKIENFQFENESKEYFASSYNIQNKFVKFRIAKKTPKKDGFFVTFWQRNEKLIIIPYKHLNDFDFLVVSIQHNENIGQFIFPKKLLEEKNIISTENKIGKRGFRLYSPWCNALNKQAKENKNWQIKYFIELKETNENIFFQLKTLYNL